MEERTAASILAVGMFAVLVATFDLTMTTTKTMKIVVVGFQQQQQQHLMMLRSGSGTTRTTTTRTKYPSYLRAMIDGDGSSDSSEDVTTTKRDFVLEMVDDDDDDEDGDDNKEKRFVERTAGMNNNPYAFNNGYLVSSGYSAYLDDNNTPKWLRKVLGRPTNNDDMIDLNEDGYADMLRRKRTWWNKVIRFPTKMLKRKKQTGQIGTLILVRHGESEWNKDKVSTCTHRISNTCVRARVFE
jgi:hypothetical protein